MASLTLVMGMENVPNTVGRAISGWDMGSIQTMSIFNVILLILAMFIDPTTVIILFGPILSVAAVKAGTDPQHFAAVANLIGNIGLLTPPLGVCLFAHGGLWADASLAGEAAVLSGEFSDP